MHGTMFGRVGIQWTRYRECANSMFVMLLALKSLLETVIWI